VDTLLADYSIRIPLQQKARLNAGLSKINSVVVSRDAPAYLWSQRNLQMKSCQSCIGSDEHYLQVFSFTYTGLWN